MIGKSVGPYTIIEQLGVGGMGEVFRARDTNLDRDVAIKALSRTFAQDAQRLARFEREAKLLAALNHPNIAAIYGLERAEGMPFIVLEMVDGQTLEKRLGNGPLPVEEALRTSRQIAEALEAAHERGIIHRDLKPANIMITGGGQVKILDFGIAKPLEFAASGLESTELTATGMLLGTAPYMSPEQIRGKPITQRSDIWSFGCLLFEMLTGRRAFDRETPGDTLAAILEHEPPWHELPDDTPATIHSLLGRTLEKEADRRLADIKETQQQIDAVLAGPRRASTASEVGIEDAVAKATEAVERYAWQEAFELLSGFADSLPADDLSRFARAAWWTGHLDVAIEADERAYAMYMAAGNRLRAAESAVHMADHHARRLASALVNGWLARAARLLEGEPESTVHGWLLRLRIKKALEEGRFDDALADAKRMLEIGNSLPDADLQALGIHYQGMSLLKMGKVSEGMALMEEAAVAAISGELSPMATAFIYCNAISACRATADYRRAGEWTAAAKQWCERQAIAGFPGVCRVFRAEVMRLHGQWQEAESEVRRACAELESFAPNVARVAFHELGEIHLRMGDFSAAEEAFRQAEELGRDPQPGLALLWLAKGDVAAAVSSIKRALEREASDRIARARLLAAQVEITLAAEDLDTARAACEELEAIARDFDSPVVAAAAEHAWGATKLSENDPTIAARHLRTAIRLWDKVNIPYECARARELLALTYLREGDKDAAKLELQAALTTYERLGAGPDSHRAAAQLTSHANA